MVVIAKVGASRDETKTQASTAAAWASSRCGRWADAHATDRYRQSQFVGLTRLQLDEIGRERQVQRQGAQRAEARAELSVELAQARILPAYELGR